MKRLNLKRKPPTPGTGLGPLKPSGDAPRRIDGLGKNARAWCYECAGEHRWEEPCPVRDRYS